MFITKSFKICTCENFMITIVYSGIRKLKNLTGVSQETSKTSNSKKSITLFYITVYSWIIVNIDPREIQWCEMRNI